MAVVVCGVLLFKLYRDWRDSIFDVNITEFEDLRLKDVIDSARKRGSNIDVLRIEMKMLEAEMLTADAEGAARIVRHGRWP